MGHSQAEKEQSRRRILAAAASRLRTDGLAKLSIGEVMTDAGLTHGAFYGHFESRSDLIIGALKEALSGSRMLINASRSDPEPLEAIVDHYLSRTHRDTLGESCAVSALASEVARAEPEIRSAMDRHLDRYFTLMAELIEDEGDPELAIPLVCTMIGALTLSRLMQNEESVDEILEKARNFILASAAAPRNLEHMDD